MVKFLSLFALYLLSSLSYGQDEYRKAELLGELNPEANRNFDRIKERYASRPGMYLRDEAYDAFRKMWKAARKEGIELTIISAFRSRQYQAGIWNRKWNTFSGDDSSRVRKIMAYSSMPGISRHHWGTDFDLNALNNAYFESGSGLKVYQWLQKNAARFGFFQPYTAFDDWRDSGYREEKWHWSYCPLAERFSKAYRQTIDYTDIGGFPGAEWAQSFAVIERFVMGIAPHECQLVEP